MGKVKAAILADDVFFHDGDIVDYVYEQERIEKIATMCDLYPIRLNSQNLDSELSNLSELEVIFSCWGMPKLTSAQLDAIARVRMLFYAGGAINGFSEPLFERGITISSAVQANAIPVAEFCLAQTILSCKGAYRNTILCNQGPWSQENMPIGRGIYGETVALIGVGFIARYLLKLLKPFELKVIAVSNCLNETHDRTLGIDRFVDIDTAFRDALVVSNHLPDLPDTRRIYTGKHFASMREGATFINTGRGTQIDEAGMIEVLKQRPDLTVLLDVQHPEPPNAGSALYDLPNVFMTSHIAGSVNDEVHRMADFILEEFKRYLNNETLKYAVKANELGCQA